MDNTTPDAVIIKDAEVSAMYDDYHGTKTECPFESGRPYAVWWDSYYTVALDLSGEACA